VERWGNGDLSARMPAGGDDEVGFLAQRFNRAAEQIQALMTTREALLASQKSLLANASHELRSPLTRIRMGLELMGNSPGAAAKDEISRNIAELDQLIDEILLASRLDAQEADMGTVEPVDLVGLCAEECARSRATLDVDVAAVLVPGVAKLLRRAVRNLLENAHRHADGEVTVVLRQDGSHAVLQVNDSGPGVPAALAERIFEPFYRLPGASERDGGVGLGLALVKSIAQRHGGIGALQQPQRRWRLLRAAAALAQRQGTAPQAPAFKNTSRSGAKFSCKGSSAPPSARASEPMLPATSVAGHRPSQS